MTESQRSCDDESCDTREESTLARPEIPRGQGRAEVETRDTLSNEAVNASGNDRYTRICRRGKMRDNPLAHIRIRTVRDPAPIYRSSYIKLNYLLSRESMRFLANALSSISVTPDCERSRASEQLIRERVVVRIEEIRSIRRSSLATCRSSRVFCPAVRMRSALLSRRGQTVRRQIILAVSRLILLAASPGGPHVHHHGTRTCVREGRREPFRGLLRRKEGEYRENSRTKRKEAGRRERCVLRLRLRREERREGGTRRQLRADSLG